VIGTAAAMLHTAVWIEAGGLFTFAPLGMGAMGGWAISILVAVCDTFGSKRCAWSQRRAVAAFARRYPGTAVAFRTLRLPGCYGPSLLRHVRPVVDHDHHEPPKW